MFAGLILVFLVFLIAILWMEIRKWFVQRKLSYFESPKQIPILGVAGRFFGKSNDQIIDIVLDTYDEVGSTPLQLWFGPVLVVGICEPDDCQTILTSEQCLDKPYFYDLLKCKSSIIVTDKEIWKTDRRMLSPSFNVKILQSYVALFNDKSHILIQKMQSHIENSTNLYRSIFTCMMDFLAITTMGTDLALQSDRGNFYFEIFKRAMNNIQYRISRYWLRWDFTYSLTKVYRDEQIPEKIGTDLLEDIYRNKMTEMKESNDEYGENNNGMNFLEICIKLQQNGIFSEQNVLDQMRLIIFAGIDSTAITGRFNECEYYLENIFFSNKTRIAN